MTSHGPSLFDVGALHVGAAAAIDTDGEALLELAETGINSKAEPPAFTSRRIPKATITSADLAGEPLLTRADMRGRTTSRYFPRDGKLVALREGGYAALRRLVEKIRRAQPFNDGLSEEFVEVEIFKWWRARLRNETKVPLSVYMLESCAVAVKRHRIFVPLSNIEIEHAFRFGDVLVTPIGRTIFDERERLNLTRFPDKIAETRETMEQLRDEFAHLTAVAVDVVGESNFAQDHALGVAADIADLLRFMSPAAITWNVAFACLPLGREHEPERTTLNVTDGVLGTVSTGLINRAPFRWHVSFAELDGHMKDGFGNCAAFFDDRPLTSFERRVKTAISAYSQGIATNELRHRLMYAMSAAEHLLLRDENEPLQTTVGERMAFMIAKAPDKRRTVVANFKKAYGLRSRQIHHLAGISDEEVLDAFFINMFLMLTSAMDHMPRFKEHRDFLDAIDAIKFA